MSFYTSTLKLDIASFSVTLDRFFSDQIPRIEAKSNDLQYSAYNTPIVQGEAFELPYIWTVEALCTRQDYEVLLAIRAESDRLRRIGDDWRIRLTDKTFPVVEKAPRTRALAAGGSEVTIGGDYVSYSARFYVWMPQQPQYRKMGKDWGVSFTLQEAGKFEA